MSTDALLRLVSVAEMRALEQAAFARGVTPAELMETAGLAVARAMWRWVDALPTQTLLYLVGSGNNGGDGLIAARALAPHARATWIYLVRDRGDDPLVAAAQETGAVVQLGAADNGHQRLTAWLRGANVVVDAILGIGAHPPLRGAAKEVLAAVRQARQVVQPRTIAVDVPSGVDSDSGQADPLAFAADTTISTGPAKLGLYLHPAAGLAGQLQSVDLELSAEVMDTVPLTTALATAPALSAQVPPRPAASHKGTFGKALVVSGCVQYTGAPGLAARAAGRVGAGLVTLGLAASIQPIVGPTLLDATYLPLPDDATGYLGPQSADPLLADAVGYDAVLIGPGLGRAPGVDEFVAAIVRGLATARERPRGVVVDADALNALAGTAIWSELAPGRCILTPHPGEMARLVGCSIDEVQARRVSIAREAAQRWQQIVVLKGAPTVVAAPDGPVTVLPFANPALATAGTGDVLAGTIVGLLAQGVPPPTAAQLGVWLHGAAGERVRAQFGAAGAVASDLLPHLPAAIRHLRGSDSPNSLRQ
ncbi:MAG: bifunctional ADP-dependent NAD(P)H-hydrate dehydratase/NAD(P)H-hydrate epimerase [Dehalococcoidia bacterium]|nr:bifunctional ADP-dependent NAD(P)H-hydrate dehydratase/NAD(P)H-hydrate epimerase [Dehalococcoidia bacterium]